MGRALTKYTIFRKKSYATFNLNILAYFLGYICKNTVKSTMEKKPQKKTWCGQRNNFLSKIKSYDEYVEIFFKNKKYNY